MISKIVNGIKDSTEKLDKNVSKLPWKSLWSVPKIMYGTAKYLIYHPTRLTIKGLPYAADLKKTWKQNIRPKIPFGDPDVNFDVKANKTTGKDYGISFDPIMKKKDHDKDVTVKIPKYKLPQRSIQQFEAWLESDEEDKKNENFIPKSSDKKKLSDDEQKAYSNLIELYESLKKENGLIRIEGKELIITIDIAGKTLEQIGEQVKQCCDSLDLPDDTKMIGTTAKRLYKQAQDQAMSSDKPFAKTEQQSVSTDPVLPSKNKGGNIDGETIEEAPIEQGFAKIEEQAVPKSTPPQQNSDLNNTKNVESMVNIRKGEQMNDNTQDNSQFSLTDSGKFPNNVIDLQLKKGPNELQSDLISRYQIPDIGKSNDLDHMESQVREIDGDLSDVLLDKTNLNIKPSYISGNNRKRSEEVSRG